MIEPIHIRGAKTTADSIAEGRIKTDVARRKKRQQQILKKSLKRVKKNNLNNFILR